MSSLFHSLDLIWPVAEPLTVFVELVNGGRLARESHDRFVEHGGKFNAVCGGGELKVQVPRLSRLQLGEFGVLWVAEESEIPVGDLFFVHGEHAIGEFCVFLFLFDQLVSGVGLFDGDLGTYMLFLRALALVGEMMLCFNW